MATSTDLDGVTLTLIVPMPPLVTNSGGPSRHWRAVEARKKAYWGDLDLLLAAKLLPPPPPVPLTNVWASSVMHLGAAMDDDNALARHKPLMDWLVKRGYLVDDRRKHLRWSGLPEQVVKRGAGYRIVLSLSRIEE